jgi:hypothetical protein
VRGVISLFEDSRLPNKRLFWNYTHTLFHVYWRFILRSFLVGEGVWLVFIGGEMFPLEGGQGLIASWKLLLVGDQWGGCVDCFNSFKTDYFRLTGLGILFAYFILSFLFRSVQLSVSALEGLVLIFWLSPAAWCWFIRDPLLVGRVPHVLRMCVCVCLCCGWCLEN